VTGPRPRQGAGRTELAGPRQEVFQRSAAARLQFIRERHRYGLGREFLHQFRLLATTPRPHVRRPSSGAGGSKGGRSPSPPRPIGQSAEHEQQKELRAIVREEARSVSRFPPPVRPRRAAVVENVPMKLRPGRGGPMSFWELVAWHRANGTLAAFMASVGL
jgi:hypothetical protein